MRKFEIEIVDEVKHFQTPTKTEFKRWVKSAWIELLARKDAKNTKEQNQAPMDFPGITICLVDKSKSAELNQLYRKKIGPTNVLSFHYESMPGIPIETLGDLIICSEVVAEEADSQNVSMKAHFAHLTIHGVLHLQGYDHETDEEACEMEQLETKILQDLGFRDPYNINEVN